MSKIIVHSIVSFCMTFLLMFETKIAFFIIIFFIILCILLKID